ncbi:MAG: hypothetical protein JW714_01835 [Candidatus Omnitrophica bacterium]|nr:hypothetical protein [Candidatus Omnitrophota bacterium]
MSKIGQETKFMRPMKSIVQKLIYWNWIALIVFSFASFGWAFQLETEQAHSRAVLQLVFVSLNYAAKEQFDRDVSVLIEKIAVIKPFDEFMQDIAFSKVKLSLQEEKALFKRKDEFPYLAVRQDFLDGLTQRLRTNYKLVILDATNATSCAELSSLAKLSLIIVGRARYPNSDSFAKGFLHELGHSFGLRDESPNSQAKLCPPGPPNCATTKEEAEVWWGDLVGKVSNARFVRGCCGNKDYFRPTIASLMNNPEKARSFGPVNELYLRQVLQELLKNKEKKWDVSLLFKRR